MKNKVFRKMIVLAICVAMTVQTFIPQFTPITAYGAENPEAVRAVSAGSDEAGTGDISGETDASDVGDISGDESTSVTEGADTASAPEESNVYEEENAQESFVPETELDAKIIEQLNYVPTPEEIAADEAEKAEYDRRLHENDVDDSDKLLDESEEDAEGDSLEAVGASYSNVFSYKVNGVSYQGTIDQAVDRAINAAKPLELEGDVTVNKTVTVERTSRGIVLDLRCNSHTIAGSSDLGNNEIFSVKADTTLRISNGELRGGGDGAIIAKDDSIVELLSMKVIQNKASRNGGAVYLGKNVKCVLYGAAFSENRAGRNGGAIYANGSNCNIYMDSKTFFENNRAENHGGAIFVNGTSTNIYGPSGGFTTLKNNSAGASGGAIYADSKETSFYNLSVTDNVANGDGGGIFIGSKANSFSNLQVLRCVSLGSGGGIYINEQKSSFSNTDVRECEAKKNGGGIFVDSRYNIGTGGKMYIFDNINSVNKGSNNLYLQKGSSTTAYIKIAVYSPGSKIGIFVNKPESLPKISYEETNCDPRQLVMDNGGYYISYITDRKNPGFRNVWVTNVKSQASFADVTNVSDRKTAKRTTTQLSDKYYVSSNGGYYPILEGYASAPSLVDLTKDIVNKYFYSDGYFIDSPYGYNEHLATFGINLAMASANSNIAGQTDYSYKFDNVKSVLEGIGCKDICVSDSYSVKPTESSIGVAIGRKEIEDRITSKKYTLLPIVIRSHGYEKEWASNMIIDGENTKGSANSEHSGFRDARTKVVNEIEAYISKNGLTGDLKAGNIKFFLVGYSRGGATANLTGKELVDKYGFLSKYKNSVYAYCYEAPIGATDSEDKSLTSDVTAYFCIHNIINKVDLVPMVPPEKMGFKHYGVDHYVPGGDAGSVKTSYSSASKANGGYKMTVFYDNDAWYTDSDAYYSKRKEMLDQLRLVNDELCFVDYFKEARIDLGKAHSTGQIVKGLFTYREKEDVQINEISSSSKTLEQWLTEFYSAVQEYNTLGADTKLTRSTYSTTKVTAGKNKSDLKSGEHDWSSKGATPQDTFKALLTLMYSLTPTEMEELGLSLAGIKNKLGLSDMYNVFEKLINSRKGFDYSKSRQQEYLDLFWNKINDNKGGQKALKDAITDQRVYESFENTYPSLLSIVLRIVRDDYNNNGSSLKVLGTFAHNADTVIQGHFPEVALSWLRSYDSYYNNETTAYRWASESDPGDQVVAITEGRTNEGDTYITMDAGDDREIFYQVYLDGTDEKSRVTKHYNKGEKVYLKVYNTTGQGNDYKVKTWTYRSYVGEDRKIKWVKGDELENDIFVPSSVITLTVKGQYGKNATPTQVQTKTTNKGCIFTLDECYYRKDNYRFYGWKKDDSDSYYSKSPVIKVPADADATFTAVYIPVVTKAQLKWTVYNDIYQYYLKSGKFKNDLINNELTLYYSDNSNQMVYAPISWWYKNKSGVYVKADQNGKVLPSTKYQARVVVPVDKDRSYAKQIKVVYYLADQTEKEASYEIRNGEMCFTLDFETPTDKKIINYRFDSYSLGVNQGTKDEVIERLKAIVPQKCCTLIGNDGVTEKNVKVNWEYDNIRDYMNNEYTDNALGLYNIWGTVDESALTKLKGYTNDLTFGKVLLKFTVAPNEKYNPPVPSPLANSAGDYYIVGYDDEVPEDAGKLQITLSDHNGDQSTIRYSVSGGSLNASDAVYSSPIDLPYPKAGEKVTYVISAKCLTDRTGYENSNEIILTYNIYNPHAIAEYSVMDLGIKLNKGTKDSVVGKLKEALPEDVCTVKGSDGVTDKNVRVEWDYDGFEEGYSDNATGIYVINGYVDRTDLENLIDYSWKDKTGQVTQKIEIIETTKCASPVAAPMPNSSGEMYIVGTDEEVPEGTGKLQVTLTDPNSDPKEIRYSVTGGSLNVTDAVYKNAIDLPYPEEDETVTYVIKAKCVTDAEGYENSDEQTFTYNIYNLGAVDTIEECHVKDFGLKINKGTREAVIEKLKSVVPTEVCTVVGSDGVTDKNVRVNWDFDSFSTVTGAAYADNATGMYVLKGYVDRTALDKLEDHSWEDETGLVTQYIEVIETRKLTMPQATPLMTSANEYYTVGVDEEVPETAGTLQITLNDNNDVQSTIKYSVSGGTLAEVNDEEYASPIELPYPEEGSEVSYVISAKCVTDADGYKDSDEQVFTYNILYSRSLSVNILCEDYNELSDAGDITEFDSIITTEKNSEIVLDATEFYDDETDHFVRWEVLKDGVFEEVSDEIVYTATITDSAVFRAVTVPVISKISAEMEAPVTGEGLPDVLSGLYMTVGGEEKEIDPDCSDVTWVDADSDKTADYEITAANTKYSACIEIGVSANGLYSLEKESDSQGDEYYAPKYLGKYFFLDPEAEVRFFDGTSDEDAEEWEWVSDDENLVIDIDLTENFGKTGAAEFISVYPPDGIEVAWNSANKDKRFETMKESLPKVTKILVNDGSIATMEIGWDYDLSDGEDSGVAYEYMGDLVTADDINGLDDWALNLMGYVVIPGDMGYDEEDPNVEKHGDENRYYFEYPVYLAGAPVSAMPDIYPEGGEYDVDEDVFLTFDTDSADHDGNVTDDTERAKADIYYRVDPVTLDEEGEPVSVYDSPVYYDENGKLVITEGTVKVGDQDYDHISGEDYPETGAIVTAVAIEENSRVSEPRTAYFKFYEKPAASLSDNDLESLMSMTLQSGGKLDDLTSELPAGVSWDPEQDIYATVTGSAGDDVTAYVVYNPDPDIYRDSYYRITIELTAGVYDIMVDNGSAYDGTEKIEIAEAGWTVTLLADEPGDGMQFDQWQLFTSNGDEVNLVYDSTDKKKATFTMPECDVYASAVYSKTEQTSDDEGICVESLSLDKSSADIALNGSVTLVATPVYKSDVTNKPEVTWKSGDDSVVSLSSAKGKTVTVKGLKTGKTTIWAVCEHKAVSCTVTVGENVLCVTVANGSATLADGTDVNFGEAVRGAIVTLEANSPQNGAMTFDRWETDAAGIDKTKAETTFRLTTDVFAKALYKPAEGFEDAGEYTETSTKIKSLTLTDHNTGKKMKSTDMGLDDCITVDAKAVFNKNTEKTPGIVFRSSNTDVVRVKTVSANECEASATIVGCRGGSSEITAYCGNKKVKFTITVSSKEVGNLLFSSERVESTETTDGLYSYQLTLKTGEQELVEVAPEETETLAQIKYTWKSDDKKVATVKNGLITAKSKENGRTTITVTAKAKQPGEKKWATLSAIKLAVNVEGIDVPKKQKKDKSYSLSMKGSVKLDLNAERINKKNVFNEYDVVANIKGTAKDLEWTSTNEGIVAIDSVSEDDLTAHIRGVGIGTAYVVLTGTDPSDQTLVNRAVMKVTVKATAPELAIASDTLGLMDTETNTLTLKAGDYDRLFHSLCSDKAVYQYNTTEALKWSAKGGVSITQDGLVYARKATKDGKPATVTLKCGKSKITLNVVVK